MSAGLKITIRISLDTDARLSRAMAGYGLSRSAVVQRAVCAFLNRGSVVLGRKQKSTTRMESVTHKVSGVPRLPGVSFDALIDWYLSLKGSGISRPRVALDLDPAEVADMRRRERLKALGLVERIGRPYEGAPMG